VSASPRLRYIVGACVAYAAIAGLWIVFSDLLLGDITEKSELLAVSLLKGLAFVAVTTVGLGVLLARAPTLPNGEIRPVRVRALISVFVVIAVTVGAIAWVSFRAQADRLHEEVHASLEAIARLKVAGITRWAKEYENDVEAAAAHPGLREALAGWRLNGRATDRARVDAMLEVVHQAYCPSTVELRAPDGTRLTGPGTDLAGTGDVAGAVRAAAQNGQPGFIDLRPDSHHGVHLSWLAPVRAPVEQGGAVIGVLVCDETPERFLYPFIRTWPRPSDSGETLLVRRDGDDVVFLNDLLHYAGAALFLRLPLSSPALPAAQAARGEAMRFGVDYRGVPVIAAGMNVPGTPWFIVSKIDRAEAEAPVRRLAVLTWALTGAALAVAASLLLALWQQQRRRVAEMALIQARALDVAEGRLRSTLDQAAVGMAILGRDGSWRLVNARLCLILGIEADTLARSSFADILPGLVERGAVPPWFDDPVPVGRDVPYARRGADLVWLRLTAARSARGEPDDAYILVIEDVSERHRAEERVIRLNRVYRTLSETNQMIVRISERADLFRSICRIGVDFGEFRLVTAARPDESGRGWEIVEENGPASPLFRRIDPCLILGGATRDPAGYLAALGRETRHRLIAAEDLPRECRDLGIGSVGVFPLIERGQTTHALLFFAAESDYFDTDLVRLIDEMALDVSFGLDNLTQASELRHAHMVLEGHRDELERRVAERTAELSAAKERAEAADRVKSAFLATMSHELRTPLNSVIGFTGVLLSGRPGPLTPEQVRQLTIVRNAGHRLLGLIGDVLDISKIEAGEMTVEALPVDLAALIERVTLAAQHLAQGRELGFSVSVDPLPGPVLGDVRRIEQIIDNLVSNAVKFTRTGDIRITCRVEDGQARIAVADTGIGIRPEDISRLFLPFVQIEGGTVRGVKEGTGLGLSICRHLVEAMSGRIWVDSVFGRGSTFQFTLPFAREAS